jgi:hypothetical protein
MAPYIGSTPVSDDGVSIGMIVHILMVVVALLIGIMLFSAIVDTVDDSMQECAINGTEIDTPRCQEYNQAKHDSWYVIGILPLLMVGVAFFIAFGKVFTKKVDHDDDPTTAPEIVKISLLMYVLLVLGLAHKVEKKDD